MLAIASSSPLKFLTFSVRKTFHKWFSSLLLVVEEQLIYNSMSCCWVNQPIAASLKAARSS